MKKKTPEKMLELSAKTISLIRKNRSVKLKLMVANECSEGTLQRWLDDNNVQLTQATNLNIIMHYIDIQEHEVLTEKKI
jgi:hypothetical protein